MQSAEEGWESSAILKTVRDGSLGFANFLCKGSLVRCFCLAEKEGEFEFDYDYDVYLEFPPCAM